MDLSPQEQEEFEFRARAESEAQPQTSGLEAFGRATANNVPLVPQAIAGLSEGDYSQNLADWNAKAAEAKAEHPVPYGAGAVTGAVAPMLIPGVGAALKSAPLAGNALYGAASAISNTDLSKHPGEAVKEAIKGGTIGAVTGKLGDMIMPTAAGMTARAEKNALQSAGLNPKAYNSLSGKAEEMGQFLNENGLVQGSLEQRLAKAQQLLDTHGKAIQESGAGAAELADASKFTDPLHEKAEQMNRMYDPQFKAQANTYSNGIKEIQQNGKTFADLQRIKSAYGNRAFGPNGEVVDQAALDVWKASKDAMASIIETSPEEYQGAMTGYSHSLDAVTGLQKQLGIERTAGESAGMGGHGLHGLLKQLPGIHNPATAVPMGVAVGLMGHPVLGGVLALHSVTASPTARNAAFNTMAKYAPQVSAAATTGGTAAMVHHFINNQQSYGKFAAPLNQALQSGGSQGFAATSFVLRQQHPELNTMFLDAGEGPKDITNETQR